MQVRLNSVDGIADAIASMYFSKRSWTPEKDAHIRELCDHVLDRRGFIGSHATPEQMKEFEKDIGVVLKWGKHHVTLLKFIDLSFTVEGIHRGAQDDFDSHAQRMNNRIIRSSTRLAEFGDEMSEWYRDKIVPTDMACQMLGVELEQSIRLNDTTYVKTTNGYIREDLASDKDVKRGLYMLSIPSNFICRVDLANFAHIYKLRNMDSGASPELKIAVEKMAALVQEAIPPITRELLMAVEI